MGKLKKTEICRFSEFSSTLLTRLLKGTHQYSIFSKNTLLRNVLPLIGNAKTAELSFQQSQSQQRSVDLFVWEMGVLFSNVYAQLVTELSSQPGEFVCFAICRVDAANTTSGCWQFVPLRVLKDYNLTRLGTACSPVCEELNLTEVQYILYISSQGNSVFII